MMQGMVPLYGFGGGSGGTGATLTVTAPAGCTVTVSKDGKSKTKVAGADGKAVFKGLETGEWTITITDGEQTAQKTAMVTADYAAEITFFAATINVTYPAGSACTATDGTTTLTAPDTSGTWECVVPNAGTWTVSLDRGYQEKVNVTASGNTYTLKNWHLYNAGVDCTAVTGGWAGKGMKSRSSSTLTAAAPTITTGSAYITATNAGEEKSGTLYAKNKINLSGFTKLTVNGSFKNASATDGNTSIFLWSAIGTYAQDNVISQSRIAKNTTETTVLVELSGSNGLCNLGFWMSSSASNYVKITECYLTAG